MISRVPSLSAVVKTEPPFERNWWSLNAKNGLPAEFLACDPASNVARIAFAAVSARTPADSARMTLAFLTVMGGFRTSAPESASGYTPNSCSIQQASGSLASCEASRRTFGDSVCPRSIRIGARPDSSVMTSTLARTSDSVMTELGSTVVPKMRVAT